MKAVTKSPKVEEFTDHSNNNVNIIESNEPSAPPITVVKIRDQTGTFTFLRVKKTTPMSRIFSAYADRVGTSVRALKFTLDGDRLKEDETLLSRELEDECQEDPIIDVFKVQVGGGKLEGAVIVKGETMKIQIRDTEGDVMSLRVYKTTPFHRIFEAYAERKGYRTSDLRFVFNGIKIHSTETPKMREMKDCDTIHVEVILHQLPPLATVVAAEPAGSSANESKSDMITTTRETLLLTLRFKAQNMEDVIMRVPQDVLFEKIFKAYGEKIGIDWTYFRFVDVEGQRLNRLETPKMRNLMDGEEITAVLFQKGGSI